MAKTVQMTGLKEMQARFEQMTQEVQGSIALGALRAGANVVADEARRLAPVSPPSTRGRKRYGLRAGALRDDIRVTRGTISKGIANVKVRVGGKGSEVYYARMVEYGTGAHWITVSVLARRGRMTRRGYKALSVGTLNKMAARGSLKIGENYVGESVAHPGARPKPFMRPAMDNKGAEAVVVIQAYIRKKLERIARGQVVIKEAA